ncbi:unnamed protein product [Schistosoma mattheei]|uniref:Uncharacterized protein n=1 Tax=Schistosoma mattheei TaxID=31246 RepID=A0A183NKS3_9TREM|nr:unnamed protein product [Schistosoma mattheei]
MSNVTREFWPEKVDEHRLRMHEELSQLLAPCIQQVVEFAKRIPEFSSLGQPDQLVLIKAAFFEVWLVQASRLISTHDRKITLADGKQITKQELDFIYSLYNNGNNNNSNNNKCSTEITCESKFNNLILNNNNNNTNDNNNVKNRMFIEKIRTNRHLTFSHSWKSDQP